MEDLGRILLGLFIVVASIVLIFLVLIPISQGLAKLGKKIDMDGFIGWLIAAIALSIGLLIIQFGAEFLFSLGG